MCVPVRFSDMQYKEIAWDNAFSSSSLSLYPLKSILWETQVHRALWVQKVGHIRKDLPVKVLNSPFISTQNAGVNEGFRGEPVQ
jgi:hypothetical protein